jgi:hypothetical protein
MKAEALSKLTVLREVAMANPGWGRFAARLTLPLDQRTIVPNHLNTHFG